MDGTYVPSIHRKVKKVPVPTLYFKDQNWYIPVENVFNSIDKVFFANFTGIILLSFKKFKNLITGLLKIFYRTVSTECLADNENVHIKSLISGSYVWLANIYIYIKCG
jgi:hypothetical protein